MDMNQLLQLASQAFINSNASGSAGSQLDPQALASQLSGFLGGNASGSGIDLGTLVQQFSAGGLGDIAQSWLGDGANQSVSADQITSQFGQDKIAGMAAQLGLSQDEVAGGLADALPQLVDKGSSGGSLMDSLGGISGAMGMAGKLFS